MLRAFASHCWLTGGTTAIDNLPCKGFAMLWAILIGFIVGLVAKFLTPGRDPSGFFITAAIGIVGSLLATYGGQALGLYNAGEPAGFIGSVVGAVIVLAIYHLVTRKSGTTA
jgi:uncharacterized membrane protein YeaQ/YmgE (transglycosylase-associated protein family)